MDWLPPHKCGLYLTHNEHRDNYETVEAWIENQETWGSVPWTSDQERQRAIDTDSVWHLQWYPETPVGFCHLAASTLEAIRDHILAGTTHQEGT